MTIQDAVESLATDLVDDVLAKQEPKLVAGVPGLAGLLLREALALPPVQDAIRSVEAKGVHFLADEALALYGQARGWILGHLHGRAQQIAAQVLSGPVPQLHGLSEGDLVDLAKLLEAGKLSEGLKLLLHQFGLAEVSP